MFTYARDNPDCIVSYDLPDIKFVGEANVTIENGGISCEQIFKVG